MWLEPFGNVSPFVSTYQPHNLQQYDAMVRPDQAVLRANLTRH
uniref:Uncharacterized protein n=1 Tax=Rhizobium meliloti TaxID=382 RepID=I2E2F0_RHIML|nr:hypothetical protein pHRC017_0710 [Sinorhizobium meliloti]